MNLKIDKRGDSTVVIAQAEGVAINMVQDAMDLMADASYTYSCHSIVADKALFCDDFFDLKTRLAGEILQKYTNYHTRLAIVGDFSQVESRSLRDFIYESNKGERVFFLPDLQSALDKLHSLNGE